MIPVPFKWCQILLESWRLQIPSNRDTHTNIRIRWNDNWVSMWVWPIFLGFCSCFLLIKWGNHMQMKPLKPANIVRYWCKWLVIAIGMFCGKSDMRAHLPSINVPVAPYYYITLVHRVDTMIWISTLWWHCTIQLYFLKEDELYERGPTPNVCSSIAHLVTKMVYRANFGTMDCNPIYFGRRWGVVKGHLFYFQHVHDTKWRCPFPAL